MVHSLDQGVFVAEGEPAQEHLPVGVRIEPVGQPSGFEQSWALVIGIDDYGPGIPQLTTAANDARRLAEILLAEHGYHVILLADGETSGQLVRDVTGKSSNGKEIRVHERGASLHEANRDRAALFVEGPATQKAIERALTETLPAALGSDDRLLLYFAGHGIALDGDDGPAGYLIPQDARPEGRDTYLPMTDLHTWLEALPCRHMLAVLDCCFAGAFRWASTRNLIPIPEVLHQERYSRFIRDPAWQIITSAAYDQRALDVLAGDVLGRRGDGEQHSPFALALFEALSGAGDIVPADGGDGVITATELYLYLRDRVEVAAEEEAHHRQTPGLWPLNKHDKGEYIVLVPGHELNLPPAPRLTTELNPWRGLESYDEEHCQLFFGREDEIDDLVQLVEVQPFTAVVGASGTGKSSLVKAGLVPRLGGCAGGGEQNGEWMVLPPLRPTATPLQALQQTLSIGLATNLDGLRSDPDALAVAVADWRKRNPGRRLLLVVDQLEELVTLCQDAQEREQFLALLARAIEREPDAFRLVITLRTDFEPQFAQDTALAVPWAREGARYVALPMDHDDLRAVIEGPASVRVLHFEPYELVDELITEVIQTPGALPLLSFTLSELYIRYLERQEAARNAGQTLDRSLTEADYRELGGVIGSVRHRATKEYEGLPGDAHRRTMRQVMLRMVAVEGGELARRRVPRSELVYADEAENERVETVIQRLVQARLVVEGREDEAYVEPAHDALVQAWDRLLVWKVEAEEYLPLQRRLAQAASEWERASDEDRSGLLWDGDPRLPQVEETLWPVEGKQRGLGGRVRRVRQMLAPSTEVPSDTKWLNSAEVAFARASVRARTRTWRRVVGLSLAVLLIVGTLLAFGFSQRQRSVDNERAAQTQSALRATSDANALAAVTSEAAAVANEAAAKVAEATALAEASVRSTAQALEAEARATAVAAQQEAEADRIAFAAREEVDKEKERALLLAVRASDSQASWVTDGALREVLSSPGHTRLFFPVSLDGTAGVTDHDWSPSGSRIAIVDDQDTMYIINVRSDSWTPVTRFARLPEGAWSPDEGHLAIQTEGTVQIWSVDDPQVVTEAPGRIAATWSPDGTRLLLRDEFGLSIWEWRTGRAVPIAAGGVAEWSADGRFFVSLREGVLKVWEGTEGREWPLAQEISQAALALWSPWGARLLVLGTDERLRVWDAEVDTVVELQTDPTEAPPADQSGAGDGWSEADFVSADWREHVAWSPDGLRIVTTKDRVQVWSAEEGSELAELTSGPARAYWSPEGARLLIDDGQQVSIVDLGASGERFVRMTGIRPHTIGRWSWSPDGTRILSKEDHKAQIWDAETGARDISLTGVEGTAFWQVKWSPGGEYVHGRDWNNQVRIWDLEPIVAPVVWADDWFEIWSPIGSHLLTRQGYADERVIRVWNPDTGTLVVTFPAARYLEVDNWSASGTHTVVVATPTLAQIWDATSWTHRLDLDGHTDSINDVAWAPDDGQLVTGSLDGTARVWNATTGELVYAPLDHPAAVTSVAWSPDGERIATGSTDRMVRVWEASSGRLLRTFRGHTGPVSSVEWNPDPASPLLLSRRGSSSERDTARIWDIQTGMQWVLSYQDKLLRTAEWSAIGSHLAGVLDGNDAVVWSMNDRGTPVRIGSRVASWGPRGEAENLIATQGENSTVVVWDTETAAAIQTFVGHGGDIYEIEWTLAGDRLATISADSSFRVWEMGTALAQVNLDRGESGVSWGGWSADDRFLAHQRQSVGVTIYHAELEYLRDVACERAVRNLRPGEVEQFLPGQEAVICPGKDVPGRDYELPQVGGSRG